MTFGPLLRPGPSCFLLREQGAQPSRAPQYMRLYRTQRPARGGGDLGMAQSFGVAEHHAGPLGRPELLQCRVEIDGEGWIVIDCRQVGGVAGGFPLLRLP